MPDKGQNVAKATWKGLKTVLSSWTSASVAVDAVKKGDLRLEPAKANCSSTEVKRKDTNTHRLGELWACQTLSKRDLRPAWLPFGLRTELNGVIVQYKFTITIAIRIKLRVFPLIPEWSVHWLHKTKRRYRRFDNKTHTSRVRKADVSWYTAHKMVVES